MKPAIVVASHTMGLAVIRALGMMGVPSVVVYYDENDMGFVSKYVKERIRAPHPSEDEGAFIALLVETAARFEGSPLFPTSDAALAAVSRHKDRLQPYCRVACTEWPVTEQFLDKKRTYALAESAGVPAPKTLSPCSEDDVRRYAESAMFPCLVKPCQSHLFYARFKTKMLRVQNADQLLAAYRRAVDAGLDVMVQELIPGEDADGVNYNAYFWDGAPLVEFTAAKVRNGPPWFGSPRVAVSRVIPEVVEPGRRILQAMGFYGFACTEFKRDARDGVYKLMEVNGRHNLSGLLAVRCGLNFPWLHYRHLVEGELPSPCAYDAGVYWIDLFRDVGYSLRYLTRERHTLLDYLRPYLQPHVFAVLDLSDPRPFIRRCANLVRGTSRRSTRRARKRDRYDERTRGPT